MIRRRMTVKRVDPWSVLKLGLFLNIAGGAIVLLTGVIVWSVIRRLQMVERSCEQIQNIFGLQECAIEGATVFRGGFLMVALFVVVMTAVLVFSAFLYNLIADLTGGVEISAVDHSPAAVGRAVGGGVEIAPELQQTSRGAPVVVGAPGRSAEDVAMPPDAVDRRTREPSRLKKAAQVASTKLTDLTRQASSTLSEATKPEATSRAKRTEAQTQSLDAVTLERPSRPSDNGSSQSSSSAGSQGPQSVSSPPRPPSGPPRSDQPSSTGSRSGASGS